jgi:hypothetical protein
MCSKALAENTSPAWRRMVALRQGGAEGAEQRYATGATRPTLRQQTSQGEVYSLLEIA